MIIFSTGGKGGVGKSLVSHLLVAHFVKNNCTVIDTDMCNPDVFKCADKKVAACNSASLKTPEDWDHLMDCIELTLVGKLKTVSAIHLTGRTKMVRR